MSNFISMFRPSLDDSSSKKETFTSYVNLQEPPEDCVQECASMFFDSDLQPTLLPGERVIAEADSVLKFTPFSDGRKGMAGQLFVTNFRLSFVTADRSSYDNLPGQRRRNKLIDETDIPLTSIDTIYHVTTNGRRKKLTQGHHTSSTTKSLEVQCKDLRIHTFGLAPTHLNKQFVNAVVHHAFPTKEHLLFAYEYARNQPTNQLNLPSYNCDTPMFDCVSDWEDELKRCRCERQWRVTELNLAFECCPNLPQYFVIPLNLMNSDLTRAAPQFTNRRLPTWCYTHINKNSLVRMAALDQDTDQPEYKKKMLDSIKNAAGNFPTTIDLGEHCPSIREVQDSYIKLRKLCMSNNKKDFAAQDAAWYSSLDDSKWLNFISQCLTVAQSITDDMSKKKRTFVIQESSGCDFSPLVSCLVMIQLDPYFRTRIGFQSMFQREWVKMGHPFQKYLTLVSTSETEQVPILLLFLDCTWQLLQQYPSCFEFSETFLTTMWDTAQVGVFDTFLFNNDHQRSRFSISGVRNIKQFRLPSAWLWHLQFEAEDMSFFNDPLYILTHNADLVELMTDLRHLYKPGKHSQLYRHNDYARKLTLNRGEVDLESFSSDILSVKSSMSSLRLWMQCYLRWQAPAQILGGGSPSQYLQQCHMIEEIIHLHHQSKVMQERSARSRPKSDLIFSFAKDAINRTTNLSDLLVSTYLTSSFPFSPGPSTRDQQMLSVPTMSVYIRNSSIEYDKHLTDDELE